MESAFPEPGSADPRVGPRRPRRLGWPGTRTTHDGASCARGALRCAERRSSAGVPNEGDSITSTQLPRDVMTSRPLVLPRTASVLDAAEAMADSDIGPVLVVDDDHRLCRLLTDRDIVVRAIAPRRRLESTALEDVCTVDLATLSPSTRSPRRCGS